MPTSGRPAAEAIPDEVAGLPVSRSVAGCDGRRGLPCVWAASARRREVRLALPGGTSPSVGTEVMLFNTRVATAHRSHPRNTDATPMHTARGLRGGPAPERIGRWTHLASPCAARAERGEAAAASCGLSVPEGARKGALRMSPQSARPTQIVEQIGRRGRGRGRATRRRPARSERGARLGRRVARASAEPERVHESQDVLLRGRIAE